MVNLEEIKTKIAGEIKDDTQTLFRYSSDGSPFEVSPKMVVFPKDELDIKELVRFVFLNKEKGHEISVAPWQEGGAGSGLSDSIVIDFTKNFEYPSFHGKTKEVTAVLADGETYIFKDLDERELESKLKIPGLEGQIYRQMYQLVKNNYKLIQAAKPTVQRNAAGYPLWEVWDKRKFNLAGLLAGSEGTLGVVTKAKYPQPKQRATKAFLVFVSGAKELGEAVKILEKYNLASVQVYNNKDFELTLNFWNRLILQKPSSASRVLVVKLERGTEAEIADEVRYVRDELKFVLNLKTKILTKSEQNIVQRILDAKKEKPAQFLDEVIVHKKQFSEFLPKLESILRKYLGKRFLIVPDFTNGAVKIIPLMDLSKANERFLILKIAGEVFRLVSNFKGSINGQGGDGFLKTLFLEDMFGKEMASLFQRTKTIFDPLNIFNPKKKVGGDKELVLSHLKKQ